ncbi:hypothetical protein [Shumkonia mesophila]|uniref:hypothetical protein n=1 Tax=Shumkonia mesophila TaxID=2838854 RepID=UPI0029346824|nr:hypothetical protein [Shumkonia mesophila]
MTMISARRLAAAAGFLAAAALLAACYLPVRFDAEIEVDRSGFYSMIFDGYIVSVPLRQDLAQKKISPAEEKEKVAVLTRDLARDKAFTEVAYQKQGIFKVHWARKDDLMRVGMVTFFRRNEAILTLKYLKDNKYLKNQGVIIMAAGDMSRTVRQQIADAGLNMTGEVRLITDAKVLEHNATEVKDAAGRPGRKLYVWRLADLNAPTPHLVLVPG